MFLPLFRRQPTRETAAVAYSLIVAQSRHPAFFTAYGVPDTLDGRFELICLHAFVYLHRLRAERPSSTTLSQAVFDMMFADLDRSLREIGVGDLSVGKHVKRMARAFYGRILAYQQGLEGGDALLRAALARNLYGTLCEAAGPTNAMADYIRRAVAALDRQTATELLAGRIRFASPCFAKPGGGRLAAGAA